MKYQLSIFIISACSMLMSSVALAQIEQVARFEKEQKSAENLYFVFPMGQDGVVLLRDKNKFVASNKKVWELLWLDEDLNEKWYTELEFGNRLDVVGFDAYGGDLFFLLRQGDSNRSNMELLKVRSDLDVERFVIENDMRFDLSHFIVIKNSAILGGYVTQQPAIVIYDLGSEKPRVLPGYFLKNSEIVDLKMNVNGSFNVLLFEQTSVDLKKLKLKTYDAMGNLLIEDEFDVDPHTKLHTGTSSALIRDDMLLVGSFGNRNSRQSIGFFSAVVDPFAEHEIRFLHYDQLDDFFNYMGEKKARKYRRKAQNLANRGRNLEFGSSFLPLGILENEHAFILYGEAFQQSSTPPPPPNFYGADYYNPFYNYNYGYNRRFYAPHYYGYPFGAMNQPMSYEKKFTQSLLIAFDHNGNILWDIGFPFKQVKKVNTEQVSDIYMDNAAAYVFYKHEKELIVNKYDFETKERATEELPILLNHPDEVLRNERKEEGAIRYWYGNHMLLWGYQSIKGAGKDEDSSNRNVFYINKISIQ